MHKWNSHLPGLYEPSRPLATWGLGLHFIGGGLILALGSIQFFRPLRERWPRVHRWIGRVYILAAIATGVGGVTFIAVNGTIGGGFMNVGFALYGALVTVAALQTIRYGWQRKLDLHRAWAIRLFALAIGSWLYRMDYGFWIMLRGEVGHTADFRGWFDIVMDFFFYLPNLLVAEAVIRARHVERSATHRLIASALCLGATGFLLLGTYYFTKFVWGPAILARFSKL
jgi:hypothetical protein